MQGVKEDADARGFKKDAEMDMVSLRGRSRLVHLRSGT